MGEGVRESNTVNGLNNCDVGGIVFEDYLNIPCYVYLTCVFIYMV